MERNSRKKRKSVRLKNYDYSQGGFYFVTICTKKKEYYFGNIVNEKMVLNEMGQMAQKCWIEIPWHFDNVLLDEYVIMPNHIHGIICINDDKQRGNDGDIAGNTKGCFEEITNVYDNDLVGNKQNNDVGNNVVGNRHACSLPENACSLPNNNKRKYEKLPVIIGSFKSSVTRCIHRMQTETYFAWQKSYYDHIIRDENAFNSIRQYIVNNPLKWELDRENKTNSGKTYNELLEYETRC